MTLSSGYLDFIYIYIYIYYKNTIVWRGDPISITIWDKNLKKRLKENECELNKAKCGKYMKWQYQYNIKMKE